MGALRVLSLFAGIGGFDLGLERTGGFETVAFCEIEPFAVRVLNKHWPKVPVYEDVRWLTADRLRADGIVPDVICGGFPCQDISLAGNGAGIDGERSGLWREYARLIGELRPRFVLVENVAALLGRGIDRVLGDLASLGYDAEWHCIPASAVGASHRRDRIWVLAYPQREQQRQDALPHGCEALVGWKAAGERCQGSSEIAGCGGLLADTAGERCGEARQHSERPAQWSASSRQVLADAPSIGHSRQGLLTQWCRPETNGAWEAANALSSGQLGQWNAEPELGRVANGIPDRAHRLRCLGNAVVPQIPELIGRAILAAIAIEAATAKTGSTRSAESAGRNGIARKPLPMTSSSSKLPTGSVLIELPWPPNELSGHHNVHWRVLQPIKKKHREWAFKAALGCGLTFPAKGDIRVSATFYPPDKRTDRVNMPSRLKPYWDGIADALKVNDRRFLPAYHFAEPVSNARVIVSIG